MFCRALVSALYNADPVGVEPSALSELTDLPRFDSEAEKNTPAFEVPCCIVLAGILLSPGLWVLRGLLSAPVGRIAEFSSVGDDAG